MEISAEINKVFGQEMAKLMADQISEEELMREAKAAWNRMHNRGWNNSLTDIERAVDKEFATRLSEAIKKVMDEPEYKEGIEAKAREIVQKIREESERKLIEAVSDRIAMLQMDYQGTGLSWFVSQVVNDMMRR